MKFCEILSYLIGYILRNNIKDDGSSKHAKMLVVFTINLFIIMMIETDNVLGMQIVSEYAIFIYNDFYI